MVGVDAQSRWFYHFDDEEGLEISCNAIVDSVQMGGTRAADSVVYDNFLYNTDLQQEDDGTFYPTAAEAQMDDLVFTTDRYTNSPRLITLPGVVTTSSSPHADWCAP